MGCEMSRAEVGTQARGLWRALGCAGVSGNTRGAGAGALQCAGQGWGQLGATGPLALGGQAPLCGGCRGCQNSTWVSDSSGDAGRPEGVPETAERAGSGTADGVGGPGWSQGSRAGSGGFGGFRMGSAVPGGAGRRTLMTSFPQRGGGLGPARRVLPAGGERDVHADGAAGHGAGPLLTNKRSGSRHGIAPRHASPRRDSRGHGGALEGLRAAAGAAARGGAGAHSR